VDRLELTDTLEDLRHDVALLYYLMPLVLPGMCERQRARLIGVALHPGLPSPAYAYDAAKAAWTQALWPKAKHGIRA
jgi:hypothetical protein